MTIEQEATAIFAAELAAFLEKAIAKIDALVPRTERPPAAEQPPEKPAKKPRKQKAPVEPPVVAEPTNAQGDAASMPDAVVEAAESEKPLPCDEGA
jgi:hypothetical protein